jgi:hypothetical protein
MNMFQLMPQQHSSLLLMIMLNDDLPNINELNKNTSHEQRYRLSDWGVVERMTTHALTGSASPWILISIHHST